MGTLNDEILRVTGGPTVQDGLRRFYVRNGVSPFGNLLDMEREYLLGAITVPVVPATTQDLWLQLFAELGFTGTYNDGALQFWSGEATPTAVNQLTNSSWQGISGSLKAADFVPPTGWTIDGNFTPLDAEAVPDSGGVGENGCRIIGAIGDRAYFIQAGLDGTTWVGQKMNFSCFVDANLQTPGVRLFALLNGATFVSSSPIPPGFTGRVYSIWEITGPVINVRIGLAAAEGGGDPRPTDFIISRPQLTLSEYIFPYDST